MSDKYQNPLEQAWAQTSSEPPNSPSESSFAAPTLLAESVEYTKTLVECGRVTTVADMLSNTAYVYLGPKERLALAWRVLKTIFR